MNVILGIDPGKSGAIASIDPMGAGDFCKLDQTERDIAEWLACYAAKGTFAFIERVHSSPQMGVVSAFSFGRVYGLLLGLLSGLGIPFEEVTPQKWQKEMGCLSKGDKNVTKRKCQQLFPEIRVTHATADSLLIAEYGRRVLATRHP